LQVEDVIHQLLSDVEKSPKPKPCYMLASPFRRAQQTAQIAHKLLGLDLELETEEMLVHSADEKVLGDYLLASNFNNLMIVSHMPIVACLCHYLSPSSQVIGFKTAQIAKLSIDDAKNVVIDKVYLPNI